MRAFHIWFVLAYVCQACPWPLERTTHKYVLRSIPIGNTTLDCSWGCGIEPTPAIWFKVDQQDLIDEVSSVLGIIGLIFTSLCSFNLMLQHKDRATNLLREDLSYQIPFIINCGYFIFMGTTLFHPGSFLIDSDSPSYCNTDENTASVGDPANGNVKCTILSLIVFIIIKLEISYTTLLSIVLFYTLWFPGIRIRHVKLKAHGLIWAIIAITTFCVIYLNSMAAVVPLRMCLPTLRNPSATLWLEIIPFMLYQTLGTVLLFLCLYKLWRMWVAPAMPGSQTNISSRSIESTPSKSEPYSSDSKMSFNTRSGQKSFFAAFPRATMISFAVKDDPQAKKLHELWIRLLLFNLVHSSFVGILCFNFFYWYSQHDKWESVTGEIIECQVKAYGIPRLRGMIEPYGTELEAAYDCVDIYGQDGPPAWALWIFYVCLLGGTFAGFVLTCSNNIVQKYKSGWNFTMEKIGINSTRDSVNEKLRADYGNPPNCEMVTIPRTSINQQQVTGVLSKDSLRLPAVTITEELDNLCFASTENIIDATDADNLITSTGCQSIPEKPENISVDQQLE